MSSLDSYYTDIYVYTYTFRIAVRWCMARRNLGHKSTTPCQVLNQKWLIGQSWIWNSNRWYSGAGGPPAEIISHPLLDLSQSWWRLQCWHLTNHLCKYTYMYVPCLFCGMVKYINFFKVYARKCNLNFILFFPLCFVCTCRYIWYRLRIAFKPSGV